MEDIYKVIRKCNSESFVPNMKYQVWKLPFKLPIKSINVRLQCDCRKERSMKFGNIAIPEFVHDA